MPWEVMRGPGETDPSVAVSVRLQVARGVFSDQPATPQALRGPVRVLAVGATSTRSLVQDLGASLAPSVEAGLLEWLPPSVGEGATWPALLARLQRAPHPQVLHFIVHGGVRQGQPALLLDEDQEEWLDVELLAATLAELEGAGPRLVYLQSCSGAKPGELASAAEHIAMVGPQAVVAHQWDVRANLSRVVARAFYGELVGPAAGDVALSLSRARLSLA
ncbi:MAG: CHAT domain-containing protein, partial [Alphaproteobacteria bacterium]|nr:CHAT domain-containing protein [Alphaproteobacteria bacterium]